MCSFILIFGIVVSIVTWIISTLPSLQNVSDSCTSIQRGNCEPEPLEVFKIIESVCVVTFTIEYIIRLLTVHSVRFPLLNEVFMEAVLTGTNVKQVKLVRCDTQSTASTRSVVEATQDAGIYPRQLDSKLRTLTNHMFAFPNIIDILAILPFWLTVFGVKGGGGFLVVLRILRL